MPYYIFSVNPGAQYKKLSEFGAFGEASAQAKTLRTQQAAKTLEKIKVMFAESEDQAIELMLQVREPGPKGDD
jgi:hypothetical protein